MTKTISLELAKYFKAQGWDEESESCWRKHRIICKLDKTKSVDWSKWYLTRIKMDDYENQAYRYEYQHIRAYTWQEILIDYAKEFFGEAGICDGCFCIYFTGRILKQLQQDKIQEAESYIKSHLLTNKK